MERGHIEARKRDLKQVDDVAKELGLDRDDFGEFVHQRKQAENIPPGKHMPYRDLRKWGRDYMRENGMIDDSANISARDITKGAAVVGGGYVIYRGVRMLPSLVPTLWWTIPANVATP